MKKEISILILLAILIVAVMNLASAEVVYAGESYSFESEEFEYYTVSGNSSNMEGMSILWEDGATTISLVPNFAPDSFILIFFNQKTEVIVEHHYSSGGSSTKYVDKEVLIEVPTYIDRETIKLVEVDKDCPVIEEKVGFFKKIWNWIKGLFGGKKNA